MVICDDGSNSVLFTLPMILMVVMIMVMVVLVVMKMVFLFPFLFCSLAFVSAVFFFYGKVI